MTYNVVNCILYKPKSFYMFLKDDCRRVNLEMIQICKINVKGLY